MGTLRRTGQRHRAVRPVVAFVIAFLVALGPAIAGAPWNEASATQNSAAPGSLLTNTALDGYSELGQIDMLSPSFGYALADHPLKGGHFAYYLVRTTTLGKSWTIVGRRLFEDGYYPNLDDEGGFDSNPPIDFVTRDVGYVAGPRGIIYMTSDAGRSWSRIASSSGYGVTSSTLSLVNTRMQAPRVRELLVCEHVDRVPGGLGGARTVINCSGHSVGECSDCPTRRRTGAGAGCRSRQRRRLHPHVASHHS